jgi:hypothetical protein
MNDVNEMIADEVLINNYGGGYINDDSHTPVCNCESQCKCNPPAPLGLPSMNFDQQDVDQEGEQGDVVLNRGSRGDKPTPLGLPKWDF